MERKVETIKYPFAVTIREFCRHLDKRDGCQFHDLELNEEPVYSCRDSNEYIISWMVND